MRGSADDPNVWKQKRDCTFGVETGHYLFATPALADAYGLESHSLYNLMELGLVPWVLTE